MIGPRDAVAVIGAGRMGSHIGCEYALGGHPVTWIVRSPERARDAIDDAFALAESSGVHAADAVARGRAIARTAAGPDDAQGEPALVVESVEERLETKVELLGAAAAAWPSAILASNTSSLEIGAIGRAVGAAERTIGTHYWNPPLLMPLVEVIRAEETLPAVVDAVVGALRRLGKEPVVIQHEVPGFVWNRLQFALLREALWLVENGVADPETVDRVVRSGNARRWRHLGVFETVALGGVQTFATIAAELFPVLSTASDAAGLERWVTDEPALLDELRRRRDDTLARELRAERGSGNERPATSPDRLGAA